MKLVTITILLFLRNTCKYIFWGFNDAYNENQQEIVVTNAVADPTAFGLFVWLAAIGAFGVDLAQIDLSGFGFVRVGFIIFALFLPMVRCI